MTDQTPQATAKEVTRTTVTPGQVWADTYHGNKGRTIRVERMDARFAYCVIVTPATNGYVDTTGRKTRVDHQGGRGLRGYRLVGETTAAVMTAQIARLDQLAAEIRSKTAAGVGANMITELAAALSDQTASQFPDLDPATIGAVLMDAATRLQAIVTDAGNQMTGQAVVSVLAAAGEQLYTYRVAR